jgi:hypothetical protein
MSWAICNRCQKQTEKPARGLCHSCYSHWWRHHQDRPIVDKDTRRCDNCNELTGRVWRRGLCNRCYTFVLRTGKPRPITPSNDLRVDRPLRLAGRRLVKLNPRRAG